MQFAQANHGRHFSPRLNFLLEVTSLNEIFNKSGIVVLDKLVQTNMGRYFKHTHKAQFSKNAVHTHIG